MLPDQYLRQHIRGPRLRIEPDHRNRWQGTMTLQEDARDITIGANTEAGDHSQFTVSEEINHGDQRSIGLTGQQRSS